MPTGLLKGIDPLLTADLLYVLRLAGHGDVISVVDVNFPAAEVASKTIYGKPIVLAGVEVDQATAAICSVCPLDRFIDCPAQYMYPSPGSEVPPLGVVRRPPPSTFTAYPARARLRPPDPNPRRDCNHRRCTTGSRPPLPRTAAATSTSSRWSVSSSTMPRGRRSRWCNAAGSAAHTATCC